MTVDRPLKQAQREAQAAQDELAAWDRTLSQLARDLAEARENEGDAAKHVNANQARQAEIRLGAYPARIVNGAVDNAPPDGLLAELDRLMAERYHLDQQLQACRVAVTTLATRRDLARRNRGIVSGRYARLAGQLTDGERCEIGVAAGEFTEHRERVAAARERAGVTGGAS